MQGATHIDINYVSHQYVSMRTTLDLDDDISAKLKDLAHRKQVSFRQIANETLRRGLTVQALPAAAKPFRVATFRSSFRPGVDPLRLNQLVDDLEVERFKGGRRRR
jgi:hypothetical protein